jgi:cytoskeletal protein CcmA (bactofilin family)
MARTTTTRGDAREAVIGSSTRVRGRISGDGDLLVDGTVEGDVSVRGDLVVGDGGKLASNIEANAVTVRGELEGDVQARGLVRIESGARVRGDITGEGVSIEEGAEFAGRLDLPFELPPELGGSGGGGSRRR